MKEMSKKKKVWLCVIGVAVVIGIIGNLTENEEPDKQQSKPIATAQTVKATAKPTENPDDARLEACCVTIADSLNVTYKPKGFEVLGLANNGDASFAIYMPYTTDEVKALYAHDKQSFRDLWGDIARTTWDYLAEQGFEVPADTEVNVQVYAGDSNKCVIYITKYDTKLKV